jgi:DNA-binding NarL/FixJ family response regulator
MEGSMAGLRVMVVEDHPVLRDGLEYVLAGAGFQVVASTGDAAEALRLAALSDPDLALVDIFLSSGNGLDLARDLAVQAPDVAVVFYTGHEDRELAARSLDTGARGYVLKDRPPNELVQALQVVAGGGIYVDARLQSALLPGEA